VPSADLTPEEIEILKNQNTRNRDIDDALQESYKLNSERRRQVEEAEKQIKNLETELSKWEAEEKNRVADALVAACKKKKADQEAPDEPEEPETPEPSPPGTIQFPDRNNNYTISVTFPDGEATGYETIKINDLDVIKIWVKKTWAGQKSVKARIAVSDLSVTEWRFYFRQNMWDAGPQARLSIKDFEDTTEDFSLNIGPASPTRDYGEFYVISVSFNRDSGLAVFVLAPAAE
jgi:hypothetical protein